MPADQDASKGYDPTAEEYYHGYGCTIVSTGQKIPIAAEFTESKQAPEETAMRVTCDALAVEKPIWMLGDSAYDTLGWHDHLLAAGSCQSLRTTHETPTIRKTSSTGSKPASTNTQRGRSAEAIDARRDVQPPEWSRTNQRRRQGLRPRAFAPEAASTHEHKCSSRCAFVLVIAITNDERGDNPGSTVITL